MKTVLLIIAMIALIIAVPCLIYLTKQIKQYEIEIKSTKKRLRKLQEDLQEIDNVLRNSTVISASPQNDWHYICYSCKYINYCQESGKKPVDESSCDDYAQKGSDYDE